MALKIHKEEGYTLVETLVAMVLFVAVLLPLLGVVGDLMLDKTPERTLSALRIAQGEMAELSASTEIATREITLEGGYVMKREVSKLGDLIEVRVSVSHTRKPEKALVTLHRTILSSR